MSCYRPLRSSRFYQLTLCLACLGGFLGVFTSDLPGEDLRETTSLKYAPAEASFYSAMLRNREQVEIFLESNAYKKMRNLPLFTFGLAMLEGQWQNAEREEVRMAKELWEREENQQLARVLLDAVSREIFVYGDANFVELLKLGQEFQRTARAAQLRAARNAENDEDGKQQLMKSILEKLSQVKAPATIVGFRIADPDAAEAQISRLEKHLGELLAQHPELQRLKDRLTREKIGDASFLTLPIDGSLIPWDELPEEAREQFDERLRDALTKLKLTIGLGVKDGYVLLSIGESLELVKRMGQGKLLIDRPEMTALRKHADKRIVNIGYASHNFMEQANSVSGQLDDLVSTAETLLPLAGLGEQDTSTVLTDVRRLADELKGLIPKPGAASSFTFLTDRGFEGFSYSWGENKSLDGSQKLDILDHVGGNPIAFFAARGKYSPDGYDWCVKWLVKAWRHAEHNVVSRLSDEERQRFDQIREHALPLLERFDKATRDDLIPALRDGQAALVLDAKANSKQWHRELPSTRIPLPMLEIAMVYGVSDQAALKRAAAEFFAITQDALKIAHELSEKELPQIDLPVPKLDSTDAGDIYSFPLPEETGLDAQIAPNAGLSRDTFVLSLMPEQTKRLLKASPLQRTGPLARSDQPLASASYFNVAGLFDAITPWVNYSVRIAGQMQGDDNPQARVAAQMVAGNVTPILELLKCFGEHASVTYLEEGAVVTHSATYVVDTN